MPFSVSRRSLLRGAASVSGAGLLRLAASGQKPNGRRVLALIGDRYHKADYIRVALSKMFEGQGVMVDYTIDYSQLSRSLLTNYQLFLCLRDGMIWPTGYLGPDAYTSYEQGLELLLPVKSLNGGKGVARYRRALDSTIFVGDWAYVDHTLLSPGALIGPHRHTEVTEVYYVMRDPVPCL